MVGLAELSIHRPDRDRGRRRLGRGPPSLEPGRRSAPGGGRVPRAPRRRRRGASLRRRERAPGDRPGHRPRRAARRPRADDPDPDRPHAGRRGRRRGQTARVEAGVLARSSAAAHHEGMCSKPGSSPDVGTIGYTLGGGLGWLGRRLRLRLQPMSAIELVTADGERRGSTPTTSPTSSGAARRRRGLCDRHRAVGRPAAGLGGLCRGARTSRLSSGQRRFAPTAIGPSSVPDECHLARPLPHAHRRCPTFPSRFATGPLLDHLPQRASARRGRRCSLPWLPRLRELGEPIMDTFDQIPAAES